VARNTFPVEVLSPEGEIYNDEVEMISTRTTEGSIGILARHAPLLARLEPTELRLYVSDSDVVRFAQAEGYLQVLENRAMILIEEAHDPSELDKSDLEDRAKRARESAEEAEEGSEERRRYERDARRWEAFQRVADSQ